MTYETILYEVAGEIATVTLNRPNKLNACTAAMGGNRDVARQRDGDGDYRI